MRLLDLFCAGGGAARGYTAAGFTVTGVDNDLERLTHYPYEAIHADALSLDPEWIRANYDAVHASPPCQLYTSQRNSDDHADLVAPTRAFLSEVGLPSVMENVPSSPVLGDVVLCGSMFGLQVQRHRRFELEPFGLRPQPPPCDHRWTYGAPVTVAGKPRGQKRFQDRLAWIADGKPREEDRHGLEWGDLEQGASAMGLPEGLPWWVYAEAIPPAYAEWLGHNVLAPEVAVV